MISTFFDRPAVRVSPNQWIQQFATAPRTAALASLLRYQKRNMFKISIVDTPSQRTLVVEGTLVGAWVAELRTSWRNACQELGGRKLAIDLCNLTVISREGEEAILGLMKEGAKFSCSGVLMKHVLKQLARKKQQESLRR
jgi:hypothetical protein